MMEGYSEDLAYIHDAGFGAFARNAAPGLLSILRRNGIRGGLVVDLGCGSGIWASALTRAGYSVFGVDASPGMIRIARKKAPRARFVTESLMTVGLPQCDAVTSIGECLNYARGSLPRLFRRIHAALRPGGLFAFDVAEPDPLMDGMHRRNFWEGQDWLVLLEAKENSARRTVRRRLVSFRRVGKRYRRSEEVHHLRLYPRDELAELLGRAGFRAELLDGYGRVRLPAAHVAIVATRLPE